MLSEENKRRYQKHLLLPQIGPEGQDKLLNSRVLVVGAGGLGCPVLLYLAAAGVGALGIVDGDKVDISNLQRQVLYQTEDIGQPKVYMAIKRLKALNAGIKYGSYLGFLKADNAEEIIRQYDLVIDCTDNFEVRYLINDVCVKHSKSFIYGAIHQFEGQVSVFNLKDKNGNWGPTYRCLFPEEPNQEEIPNCAVVGVMGVLPGVIGTYQATEAIKIITGIGKPLSGELLILDLLQNTQQKIRFRRRKDAEQLIFPKKESPATMQTIDVETLSQQLQSKQAPVLIDVRNDHEFEICQLPNAQLIPMDEIAERFAEIPTDVGVVVYCHHGIRSANVIRYLTEKHQYTNLINLVGGIHAWALHVDEQMETY
jgi:sulfur-carrier protein adenylyltransferase/sulfurtransferase